jgi:hypothetical protein
MRLCPTPSRLNALVWLLASSAVALLAACADGGDGLAPTGSPPGDTNVVGGGQKPDLTCATPDEGCACNDEGQSAECSETLYQKDSYIYCQHGQRTCAGGVWGACDTSGGQVSTKAISEVKAPGLGLEGLGSPQKCVANPCDPYCNIVPDDTVGLNIPYDAGGVTLDSGLTLSPNPNYKPLNITGFRIAPKPSMTITITSMAAGSYPTFTPNPASFTAEFLCNSPSVPCNPPKFTAASWSLSDYATALIDTGGNVTPIKPVPKTFQVKGSAGSFTDLSTVNVVVNVVEAPGIPNATVNAFAGAPTGGLDNAIILYPYKNTLFPRGLTAPVIQWTPAISGLVKYSVRHKNGAGVYDFNWSRITTDTGRAVIPQNVWQAFDETASNDNAELVIQRAPTGCTSNIPGAASCQDRFYNGKMFRYCSLGYNWAQAQSKCQSMGMSLASVHSLAENDFVGTEAGSIAQGSWWLGVNDQAVEGSYKWADGSAYNFSKWNGGEPNNSGNEDCAEMYTATNAWNDLSCGAGRYFICGGGTAPTCGVGAVRNEIVIPIKFSSEPMQGTVYFWEINNGRIAKILDDGTLVQNFLKPSPSNRCLACHSVSADGSTLVAQEDGGNGPGGAFNATTGAQKYDRGGANQFMAISPTGKWTVWGDAGRLSLTNSSTTTAYLPNNANRVVAPAFSPKGKYVGYAVRGSGTSWYVDFTNSEIWRTTFNDPPVSGQYFTGTVKVATGISGWPVAAYPTYSPDENYMVFQRANALRTRNNYGQLWIASASGAGARELVTADTATQMNANGTTTVQAYNANVNYEPTFSPVESGGYYWTVFVSNRTYGNTLTNTNSPKDNGVKQMWVTPIKKNPGNSGDPSFPAFWLPGQQTNNQNMRGYFAKTACAAANKSCKWDEDCCGFANGTSACVLDQPVSAAATRHCGSFSPGVCVNDGNACTNSSQCCKSPKVLECIQGLCSEPIPTPFYTPAPFIRDYEGTCPQGTHVQWRLFEWQATTPGDSFIAISAQTAATAAALTGPPAPLSANAATLPAAQCPAGWSCTDVGAALASIPSPSQSFLRVTMMLNPTSDNAMTPTVTSWKQEYDCIPSELSPRPRALARAAAPGGGGPRLGGCRAGVREQQVQRPQHAAGRRGWYRRRSKRWRVLRRRGQGRLGGELGSGQRRGRWRRGGRSGRRGRRCCRGRGPRRGSRRRRDGGSRQHGGRRGDGAGRAGAGGRCRGKRPGGRRRRRARPGR